MYANRRLHPPVGVDRVAKPRTWIGFGVIRPRLGAPRLDYIPNPGDAAIGTTTAIHRHRIRRYPRVCDRPGQGLPSRRGRSIVHRRLVPPPNRESPFMGLSAFWRGYGLSNPVRPIGLSRLATQRRRRKSISPSPLAHNSLWRRGVLLHDVLPGDFRLFCRDLVVLN